MNTRAIVAALSLIAPTPVCAGDFIIRFPHDDGSTTYFYIPDWFAYCVLAVVAFIVIWAFIELLDELTTGSRPMTTEELEEAAARTRALKLKTDAETDLKASQIDNSRVQGHLSDIKEIIEHDRKMRAGRRKLG
jgi:hypothetical protein